MKILILSSDNLSDSTELLKKALEKQGHHVRMEDPRKLSLQLSPVRIYDQKLKILTPDLVIPRFGMYTLQQGLHLLRGFEALGIRTLNSAESIAKATNKITSAQLFAKAHLPIPKTFFFHMTDENYKNFSFQFPLVMKLPVGSQGKGVALIQDERELHQWMDLLRTTEKEVLLQEFVRGQDLRILVHKGQILASMLRKPQKKEFRANLSLGGQGSKIKLTPTEETLALEIAQYLGLNFCGIDLIRTKKSPVVLEANAFPGLTGISAATKSPLAQILAKEITQE